MPVGEDYLIISLLHSCFRFVRFLLLLFEIFPPFFVFSLSVTFFPSFSFFVSTLRSFLLPYVSFCILLSVDFVFVYFLSFFPRRDVQILVLTVPAYYCPFVCVCV